MLSTSTNTILTNAASELNAMDLGGTLQPEISVFLLDKLNRILDNWNAERGKVYADSFLNFTLTPSLNPHTIGPTGVWVTVNRPVSIEGIQLVQLSGTPRPYIYLRPRNAQWWQNQPSPTTTSTLPTDFYYDPTWTTAAPNGSVYLWPVPTQANQVQIWTRIVLGQLTQFQTVSLPPGYQDALTLTLAEESYSALRKQWTPTQAQKAAMARERIESANTVVPTIVTKDSGMPSNKSAGDPDFFWPAGIVVGR